MLALDEDQVAGAKTSETEVSVDACLMDPFPRVCIFTETYYPVIGGGETQARLLAERLTQKGHLVTVLTRRSDALLNKQEVVGGVTILRLWPTGRGQLKKWGLIWSSIPALIRTRDRYDVLFVSGFRIVGVSAVLIGKLLGKTVVLKADSLGEMSGEYFTAGLRRFNLSAGSVLFRLFLRLRNFVLKRADAFTAIAPDVATELASAGVKAAMIHPIPNSVDTNLFCPVDINRKMELRSKLGFSPGDKIVTYTGRLVSYKGLPLLLRVVHKLLHEHRDLVLVLVGTGGLDIHNCEDELRAYVKEHLLERHVIFAGNVASVHEFLQASDIFAFPTENEAFGSSLIEAMNCRLPVVTTPVGAIKNIIQDGQNGLLVEPGNAEHFGDAVHALLTDLTLAERLGAAAWETIQENYSADIVTNQYLDLFKTMKLKSIPLRIRNGEST